MIYRPVDSKGDMMPVPAFSALLRGAPAVAQLVRDRLALYAGEWWENPAWGNEIPEMLGESRLIEADMQGLAGVASALKEIVTDESKAPAVPSAPAAPADEA